MVAFDPWCCFPSVVIMIDNQLSRNVLLFSCHPVDQLCLGDPGYISRNVNVGPEQVRRIDTNYNA